MFLLSVLLSLLSPQAYSLAHMTWSLRQGLDQHWLNRQAAAQSLVCQRHASGQHVLQPMSANNFFPDVSL